MSPRPDSPTQDDRLGRVGHAGSFDPGEQARKHGKGVGGLEGGQDSLEPGDLAERGQGLGIGGRRDLEPAAGDEGGNLRADSGVVEAGRDRVRLDDLAIAILEHQRA